jgi:hypothetical protein
VKSIVGVAAVQPLVAAAAGRRVWLEPIATQFVEESYFVLIDVVDEGRGTWPGGL